MADLIEASHLIHKTLADDYICTYEPIDMCWHIKIKKEIEQYERY